MFWIHQYSLLCNVLGKLIYSLCRELSNLFLEGSNGWELSCTNSPKICSLIINCSSSFYFLFRGEYKYFFNFPTINILQCHVCKKTKVKFTHKKVKPTFLLSFLFGCPCTNIAVRVRSVSIALPRYIRRGISRNIIHLVDLKQRSVNAFSIQSCRSCYATQHLCQRPFYKIL